MPTIAYRGWPHCVRLSNGHIELIATTDVGPRILHLAAPGGDNVLAVLDEQAGLTGGDEWRIYGGHRLWHAPQSRARTELPDNGPVEYALEGDTLRLTQPVEPATSIQKELRIRLVSGEARVVVQHSLRNAGLWPVELAPWAISALRPDGVAIVPHSTQDTTFGRLPNRLMALWPWSDGRDPRFECGTRYTLLRQDPHNAAPFKVGMNATDGWAAYYTRGQLLVKCVQHQPGAPYPDFGCSVETYVCDQFLELETLGPLVRLEPGATVEHVEQWVLYQGVAPVAGECDVETHVRPLAVDALRRAADDWH
jgi:hypothetical protein